MSEFTRTFTPTLRQNSPNKLTTKQVDENFSGIATAANSASRSYTAASQAAMLSLAPPPQGGDHCWRSDEKKDFVFLGGDATSISNWVREQYSVDQIDGALASADLADTSSEVRGAGLVGFSGLLAYASGTVGKFLKDLGTSVGASMVGFIQAGSGAVLRTMQDKTRERVSVKDFGGLCDGVTDDKSAIEKGIAFLKANGGGVLEFPGISKISSTLYLAGSIAGGTSGYTGPDRPTITFEGCGYPEAGIVSDISSGSIIQLSAPGELLQWKLRLKDFLIDCGGNNVTAINGQSSDGTNGNGNNHFVDFDGLHIRGVCGVDAIGIDFGTITDSNVQRTWAVGTGSPALSIAYKINKANVRFTDCYAVYAQRGYQIGNLTEAAFIVHGGGCIHCVCDFYIATAITYSSASIIEGAFIGEHGSGGKIIDRVSASGLDVGSFTFNACQFDTNRTTEDLMTFDFGVRLTITGCNVYYASTGLTTVNLGQFTTARFENNTNMTVLPESVAYTLGNVNKVLAKSFINFYKLAGASGTTSYILSLNPSTIGSIKMPFPGSIVAIVAKSSSAFTTGSGAGTVRKNGVDTGASVAIANGASVGSATFRQGQYNFVAGDEIDVKIYLSNPFAPTPMDFTCEVVVIM